VQSSHHHHHHHHHHHPDMSKSSDSEILLEPSDSTADTSNTIVEAVHVISTTNVERLQRRQQAAAAHSTMITAEAESEYDSEEMSSGLLATILSKKSAKLFAAESAIAITAALCVTPFISMVDKAIFSNASGKATIMASLGASVSTMFRAPLQFVKDKSFRWIWFVYASTYVTANCIDRLNKLQKRSKKASATTKFIGTSTTNIGLSVVKDRAFSRMYGVTAPRPLPPVAAICYAVRDMMSVGASFTAAEPIGNLLTEKFHVPHERAQLISQLSAPLAAQIINTPIFLYGMDVYNRPKASSGQRVSFMSAQYAKTLASRWARIFPAFSIGGVVNTGLRKNVAERLPYFHM
jgi:hypothetical protein